VGEAPEKDWTLREGRRLASGMVQLGRSAGRAAATLGAMARRVFRHNNFVQPELSETAANVVSRSGASLYQSCARLVENLSGFAMGIGS
jgi:hypothetical protein